MSETKSVQSRSLFESSCSGCHGLDGRGTDKGPNIADPATVSQLSDAQLAAIITEGVIEEGMPAFGKLGQEQVHSIVDYLRTLQGKGQARTLPGDAGRGKIVFFGKGECAACHTMSGEGGFLGPDLSVYGTSLSAQTIQDEISRPQRNARMEYRPVAVTTRGGSRVEGVVRNEDNFSLQLQSRDGSFHFLQKSELQSIEHPSNSLMPTDYRQRLSSQELTDLVSYLMDATASKEKSRAPEEPTK